MFPRKLGEGQFSKAYTCWNKNSSQRLALKAPTHCFASLNRSSIASFCLLLLASYSIVRPGAPNVAMHLFLVASCCYYKAPVTTSVALVPSSDALVPSSFLLLLVRHLLLLAWHLFLVAMHLFLVASCCY